LADLDSPLSSSVCVHRWLIATPVGELCCGTCRFCGAERKFTNERFAFGQAGRNRRTVGPVRTKADADVDTGALARFLGRSDAATGDVARPL
jgi:hypothetical protein